MSEYKLEIKQIMDYPRCRIYREFVQQLIKDRNIRTSGGSGLFYYTVLCSYVNFRTSHRRLDGYSYTVYPGEWICQITELMDCLRLRTKRQVLHVLEELQKGGYIEYSVLGDDRLVKYKVCNWTQHNKVLDYNCPCQKDSGFFFLPVHIAEKFIRTARCSEVDMLLDLWISTVYRDPEVEGSFTAPVVYLRNYSGSPLLSYADLAKRWGLPKATVGRVMLKLSRVGYLTLLAFPGSMGTVVSPRGYLSTMFQIEDTEAELTTMADALGIHVQRSEKKVEKAPSEHRGAHVSNNKILVSNLTGTKRTPELVKPLKRKAYMRKTQLDKPLCYIHCYDDCKGIVEKKPIVEQFKKIREKIGKIVRKPSVTQSKNHIPFCPISGYLGGDMSKRPEHLENIRNLTIRWQEICPTRLT